MDRTWWEHKAHEVRRAEYRGELVTCGNVPGIRKIDATGIRNSGSGAILLAVRRGARRVILLGYDCQHTGGRKHWHGDHNRPLGNAGTVAKWPGQFRDMMPLLKGVEVVNATRTTALDMFPRATLEECLR